MKEMLELMMRHAVWADKGTEASLRALPDIPDAALRIFAHLGTTEWIYLQRLQGEDPFPQDFWPDLTLQSAARRASEAGVALLSFVRERDDEQLGMPVRYRNSSGTYFRSPLKSMLVHLSLHGEHHRGQLALIVRDAGGVPAVTDFISFIREEGASL